MKHIIKVKIIGGETDYLSIDDKVINLGKGSHPYDCLCMAWARCYMTHAKDFILRNKIDICIIFTIEKDSEDGIKKMTMDFNKKNMSKKEKKVLMNIIKTCPVWELLNAACATHTVVSFS